MFLPSTTAAVLLTNRQLRFNASNKLPNPQQAETSTDDRNINVTTKALNEILSTLETENNSSQDTNI
jgi:hypothetical protein